MDKLDCVNLSHELPRGLVMHISGCVWVSLGGATLGTMYGPFFPLWNCCPALLPNCRELSSFALLASARVFLPCQATMEWLI